MVHRPRLPDWPGQEQPQGTSPVDSPIQQPAEIPPARNKVSSADLTETSLRHTWGLIFSTISVLAGVIGLLTATIFGAGWWALVISSFAVAGFIITITAPKQGRFAKLTIVLSFSGFTLAALQVVKVMLFRFG